MLQETATTWPALPWQIFIGLKMHKLQQNTKTNTNTINSASKCGIYKSVQKLVMWHVWLGKGNNTHIQQRHVLIPTFRLTCLSHGTKFSGKNIKVHIWCIFYLYFIPPNVTQLSRNLTLKCAEKCNIDRISTKHVICFAYNCTFIHTYTYVYINTNHKINTITTITLLEY